MTMSRNSNDGSDNNTGPASLTTNIKSTINEEVAKELLNEVFQDTKIKLGNDAVTLVAELANYLLTETCHRASNHAVQEGCDHINIDHVEKSLTQIMLDFP